VLVATLGDSITAGSPGWDPDPRVRERIQGGADPTSQWQHWAGLVHPGAEFHNCGIYGERTDEIARRLEWCARGADALVVQGGINDIAQEQPVGPAAENLRAMVAAGRALGLRVALANVLPWNNGWPQAQAEIGRLNELLAAVACDEGVPLLPFHDTLEDPDRPGRMCEEWTSDGDHPSVAGYRRLGERAFRLP